MPARLTGEPASRRCWYNHYFDIDESIILRDLDALETSGIPVGEGMSAASIFRFGADTKEAWDWPLLKLIGHQGRPSAKVNLSQAKNSLLALQPACLLRKSSCRTTPPNSRRDETRPPASPRGVPEAA